jgi:hypothetical protein
VSGTLYRTGDRVVCIDAIDLFVLGDSEPPFRVGSVLTIDGFDEEGYVRFLESGVGGGWNISRFRKADP